MYDTNSLIEKEILSRKQQIEVKFEEFEAKFKLLVDEKEVDLNFKVDQLLEQPARAKWNADFQLQWSKFKSVEKQRWIDRLLTYFLPLSIQVRSLRCRLQEDDKTPHSPIVYYRRG